MPQPVALHTASLNALLNALDRAQTAFLQSRVAARLAQGVATTEELIEAVYGLSKEPERPEINIAIAVNNLRKRGFTIVREHGVYKHL